MSALIPRLRYDPPLEAAKYLSTGTDGTYRAIVGVLYDQRDLGQVWRKRDEILAELLARRPDHLAPYGVTELEQDLTQLTTWGTLVRQQETNLSPSEFWRKNHQFALTPPVVALERGLREYLAKQHDHGALDPSLLTNLFSALQLLANHLQRPVGIEASVERSALRAAWVAFTDRFKALKTAGIDFQSAMLSQDEMVEVSLDALVSYKQLLRQNLQAFGTRLRDYTDILRTELLRWEERAVPQWMIPAVAADDLETVARPGVAPTPYQIEAQLLEEWRGIVAWCAINGAGASLAESTVQAVQRAIQDTLRLQDQLVIGDGRRRDLRRLAGLFAACPNIETAHRVAAVAMQLPRIVHLQGSVIEHNAAQPAWETEPVVELVGPMLRGRRPRVPGEGVPDTSVEREALLEESAALRREDRMKWASLLRNGPVDVASLTVATNRLRAQLVKVIVTCLTKPSRMTQAPDGSRVRFDATADAGVGSIRSPEAGVLWIPAGTLSRVGNAPLIAPHAAEQNGANQTSGQSSGQGTTMEVA